MTHTKAQNSNFALREAYQKYAEGDSLTDQEILSVYQLMNGLAHYSSVIPKFGIAFESAIRDANALRGYIRSRNLEVPADPSIP